MVYVGFEPWNPWLLKLSYERTTRFLLYACEILLKQWQEWNKYWLKNTRESSNMYLFKLVDLMSIHVLLKNENYWEGFSLKYSLFTLLVGLCRFAFNKSRNVHGKKHSQDFTLDLFWFLSKNIFPKFELPNFNPTCT